VPESTETLSDNQAIQQELVERGRSLPGVAEVIEVYGRLDAYTSVLVNVQPSQAKNATGGNTV
jgi:hypothetical protein